MIKRLKITNKSHKDCNHPVCITDAKKNQELCCCTCADIAMDIMRSLPLYPDEMIKITNELDPMCKYYHMFEVAGTFSKKK